jgi:hypothetical protein
MLNDELKEKLLSLYTRVSKGDLSSGGEVSQQMFLSTFDVILNEEKREADIKIANLERSLAESRQAFTDLSDKINYGGK